MPSFVFDAIAPRQVGQKSVDHPEVVHCAPHAVHQRVDFFLGGEGRAELLHDEPFLKIGKCVVEHRIEIRTGPIDFVRNLLRIIITGAVALFKCAFVPCSVPLEWNAYEWIGDSREVCFHGFHILLKYTLRPGGIAGAP